MSSNSNTLQYDLFSSLISDIKTYTGKDPLLPWLRGIRKMRESLPPQLLRQKLPRFLQKCAQTFKSDRRYTNDLRYLRVWLQLMDFVDDPRALLKTMEANRIGMKKSLFYQAYALYYEKLKKFDEADQMYYLGVQNLAEPLDELKTSYEQFLHRIERYKKKKMQHQELKTSKSLTSSSNLPPNRKMKSDNVGGVEGKPVENRYGKLLCENKFPESVSSKDFKVSEQDNLNKSCSDDTVVVRFVDKAIVGRSIAEDACHHGLVEPTINTKEALNAINSMFSEPLELPVGKRRPLKSHPKPDQGMDNGFEVFVDDGLENKAIPPRDFVHEPFQIYVEEEENNVVEEKTHFKGKDRLRQEGLGEDTMVCRRFVGATISEEPQVENICHHGLVEPTINLKEAMDDINNMFGKPIDFVRTNRRKKPVEAPFEKNNTEGFVILCDDELDNQQKQSRPSASSRNESDLFEQTVCTKEAMDEINKMFGMPLDF